MRCSGAIPLATGMPSCRERESTPGRSSLIARWRNRRFRHYHGQRVGPLSLGSLAGSLKYCQVADISHGLPKWLPFLSGSWLRINRAARVPPRMADWEVLKPAPDIAFFNLQPLQATDTSPWPSVYRSSAELVNQEHSWFQTFTSWTLAAL